MAANDNKSYLSYLNKLVDQCDNTYNHSVNKTFITADYSLLTEKIEANSKALNVNDRVRITKYKNVFSKNIENCSKEIFIIDAVLKTILGLKIDMEKNNRKFLWERIVVEHIISGLLSKSK